MAILNKRMQTDLYYLLTLLYPDVATVLSDDTKTRPSDRSVNLFPVFSKVLVLEKWPNI